MYLPNHWVKFVDPLVRDVQSYYILTVDKNQTISRRFKPNSRSILTDEQSDSCSTVLLKAMKSRHRGAKQLT